MLRNDWLFSLRSRLGLRVSKKVHSRKRLHHRGAGIGVSQVLEERTLLSAVMAGSGDHEHEVYDNYFPPSYQLNDFGSSGPIVVDSPDSSQLDEALAYLEQNAEEIGLQADDLDDFVVTNTYTDAHNGVTHYYLRQTLNGLEIANAEISVHMMSDGRALTANSSFLPSLDKLDGQSISPALTAEEALTAAATHFDLGLEVDVDILEPATGLDQAQVLDPSGISHWDIPAYLQYVPTADGIELAWNLTIITTDGNHGYNVSVAADDGEVVFTADWVAHASYNVFAAPKESPLDGDRTIEVDPQDSNASPFGWHDTNGVAGADFTDTRGNNVDAYADRDGNDFPDAGTRVQGGAGLNFNPNYNPNASPLTNRDAAVTNLFYWNNIIHDIHYQYGFDEQSGNFQSNNYSNGGLANDAVQAQAQDAADLGATNNANMLTPPDGQAPRMQMFEFTSTVPRRDSDLEAGIIIHEYGHGVSNRLTGGASNANALQALQSRGMGEGWSDWHALMFTQVASDQANDARGSGNWVLGEPLTGPGIRTQRYSYDMSINTLTYGDLPSQPPPHGIGEIWAVTLWDLNWALIEGSSLDPNIPTAGLGFDPDFYNGTGGNNLAMQLVMDGMKLQGSNPSFLDARDGILAAELALTGGQYQQTLWTVFARRGMGFSAFDGGNANSSNIVEAFDVPASSRGVVLFDQQLYEVGDVVSVEVRDLDLASGGPFAVTVTSSGGDSEFVTVTETTPGSGVFTGTVNTSPGNGPQTNGTLEVLGGDTLTVTYNDADDGSGNPAVVNDTADVIAVVDIFNQDFEAGIGAQETTAGLFQVNNTNFALNNGTFMMGHPGTQYTNNEYSFYQVTVDLSNFFNVQLEFDYVAEIENFWDGFNVQASDSIIIPPIHLISPTQGLPYDSKSGASSPIGTLGYDGGGGLDSGRAVFSLSEFDGDSAVTIRFQFGTDGSVTRAGINIDNIRIFGETITADIVDVTPDPRNTDAGVVTVNFSEDVTGVDIDDFTLTRNGGDVDISGLTVNMLTGSQYTIDLSSVTALDGDYVLTLQAAGSNILNGSGNSLGADATEEFSKDGTPPLADILDVTPDPRNLNAGFVVIEFNEPVTGVDITDFSLTRDTGSGPVAVDISALSVTQITSSQYRVDLSSVTNVDGDYVFTLVANSSGIQDGLNNLFATDASDTFLVDTTSPTVDIVDVDPDPSLAVVGNVDILFDEPVTSVDISDFTLTLNGAPVNISGLTVVPTSSTEYSIDLSTVTTNDGNYILTLLAGSNIFDVGGNRVAVSASDSFLVDTNDPFLDLTDVIGPNNRATPLGVVTITFSESVFGVDSNDFSFTRDPGTGPVPVDISGLAVTQVSPSEYTIDLSTVTSVGGDGVTPLDGTYELSFTSATATIVDAVGKSLVNDTDDTVVIDSSLPSANIVDVDPDPRSTSVGPVTILFSEDVTGVDIFDFTLTRNGNPVSINGLSVVMVSGSEYTIDLSTVTTVDGEYVLTLVANGTIQDSTGNQLETIASDSDTFTIDTTLPSVQIVPVNPDPRSTNAGIVTINFSEDVTGVDILDFALTQDSVNVPLNASLLTMVTGSQYTLDLSGLTITDGLYALSLAATGSGIQDSTGLDLANDGTETFRVDTLAPTATIFAVTPDPRNEVVDDVFIQFNENVAGLNAGDFTLTFDATNDDPDAGPIPVDISGLQVVQIDPAIYSIDLSSVTTNSGDYVLTLVGGIGSGIFDSAGNELKVGANDSFTVDFGFPTLSITRGGNSPTHQTDNVQFNLTFSEEVTGVDALDFKLNLQGVTADSVLDLSDAGDADPTTFTVTVQNVAGTGRLGLDLVSGNGISDLSSNLLDPFIGSEDYVVVAPIIAFGSGVGMPGTVRVVNSETGEELFELTPYTPSWTGGIRVALGDFTGDGFVDIVTAPGRGGGPHVKVFDGTDGSEIHEFFAYSPSFKGGINLAAADIDQDGKADIITGTETGSSHVRVFNAQTGDDFFSFFAYGPNFGGGVSVAAGDITGDGIPDIITGAGPGGGPHVRVFDGSSPIISFSPTNINTNTGSFFAYSNLFTGGVFVASADVNGDGRADIITGPGAGGGPHVQVFSGIDGSILQSFFAYGAGFTGGVLVSTGFVDDDGIADVITSAGPGGGPHVRAFAGFDDDTTLAPDAVVDSNFPDFPFPATFNGGAFISGNSPQGGIASNNLRVSTGLLANSGDTISLYSGDLETIADAAIARLQATYGSTPAIDALAGIDLQVVDLPDGELGRALPGRILIDDDAAGFGWFIDTTPFDDGEFTSGSPRNAIAPSAIGRVDLLTVVLHEFGHQLGASDHPIAENPHHFMAERLSPSERRLPRREDLDKLFASEDLFDSLL